MLQNSNLRMLTSEPRVKIQVCWYYKIGLVGPICLDYLSYIICWILTYSRSAMYAIVVCINQTCSLFKRSKELQLEKWESTSVHYKYWQKYSRLSYTGYLSHRKCKPVKKKQIWPGCDCIGHIFTPLQLPELPHLYARSTVLVFLDIHGSFVRNLFPETPGKCVAIWRHCTGEPPTKWGSIARYYSRSRTSRV